MPKKRPPRKVIGDIELFVSVGRTKSFKNAAASMAMPPSTVSRRIADFERSLGVQLFMRTTRRVELTEAGQAYLARCEIIVDAAREAHDEILGMAANPSGQLRISLEADVGAILVAPAVAEFLSRYPRVSVDLDLSPRRVDLIAEGFDLAVRLGSLPDSTLIVRQVASLPVGLYASPAYLKRHGKPATPVDLEGHRRLHLLHAHESGEWPMRCGRRRMVIGTKGARVLANNMTMLRNLLRLGQGIGLMDEVMGAADVNDGVLCRVLPEWSLPPVAVSILMPSRLLPAKVRAFSECLARQLSEFN
jgi:DNA-binding transcriptional LysR family regulator